LPPSFENRDQRDMFDEIDIEKERVFGFREVAFNAEKAPIEGLAAGAADSFKEFVSIVRRQSAYFYPASVTQRFNG